ncbi:MAG: hypothetical protein AAF624_02750 [Bacteroidota bacterium]
MRTRLSLLVLLFAWAATSAAQEPVAWLTQATGDVTVQRVGTEAWTPAGAVALHVGDAVRTGRLSRATVVLANAERIQLGSGNTYAVGAPSDERTSDVGGTVASLARSAWNRAVGRSEAIATGAARPATSTVPAVLERPRFGYVLDPTPTIRWLPAQPDSVAGHPVTYRVRVTRDHGAEPCFDGPTSNDVVWTHTTATTTLAYPENETPLDPGGDYYVEVHALDAEGTAPVDDVWDCFTIATDSARATLTALRRSLGEQYPPHAEADIDDVDEDETDGDEAVPDATADLLYAAVLLDQAFYADALAVLDAVEAAQPGLASVRRLRTYVYEEAGPPALVDALLDEARATSDDPE